MKRRKLANRFLKNYIIMFILSIIIALLTFALLDFANHIISENLVKNNYTAKSLMQDDYRHIDVKPVLDNGGGVQVLNDRYEVIFSKGLNTLTKDKLTPGEFAAFLMGTNRVGVPYGYSIEYNDQQNYWLVVTFPTSIRIDFSITRNKDYTSVDMQNIAGILIAIIMFYLLLLAISTVIYSKITSIGIVNPLKKLCNSARHISDGDYSARVELNLDNEFGELEEIFNTMAQQIEQEISLRKQSEENRKKLVLDISHDLKNPLASIMGYTEMLCNKPNMSIEDQKANFNIIRDNAIRANNLITSLFELSKMESSEFKIHKTKTEFCEYIREEMGNAVTAFEMAGFTYDFNIPEEQIFVYIEKGQMDRVFQNLVVNVIQYNEKGTNVSVQLTQQENEVVILFRDNGIGMSQRVANDVFLPFVRADDARNSQTGGTGLGLAIVEKIITAHGGTICLKTDMNCGCAFTIRIPKV